MPKIRNRDRLIGLGLLGAFALLASVLLESAPTTLPAPYSPLFAISPVPTIPARLATERVYFPLIAKTEPVPARGVSLLVEKCEGLGLLRAGWYFNGTPQSFCSNAPFVPMIPDHNWQAGWLDVALAEGRKSGWLLGYNEPNLPYPPGSGQPNMSPRLAAQKWHEIEMRAAGVRLVSPATSQHNPGWLWEMVTEYQILYGRRPRFDAIAWHTYYASPNTHRNYLLARRHEALARGYDVPFWLTEFGGACWDGVRSNSLNVILQLLPWLEAQPWIGRYAWFSTEITGDEPWASPGWRECALVRDGALTALGGKY